MPDDPEAGGLHALLLLLHARAAARVDADGVLVPAGGAGPVALGPRR